MTLDDTLWKYLGWLKKIPEPFKTIIFLVIYIPFIPIWVAYSFYLYFKKKWGKK